MTATGMLVAAIGAGCGFIVLRHSAQSSFAWIAFALFLIGYLITIIATLLRILRGVRKIL
jgi:hypothetical protein